MRLSLRKRREEMEPDMDRPGNMDKKREELRELWGMNTEQAEGINQLDKDQARLRRLHNQLWKDY